MGTLKCLQHLAPRSLQETPDSSMFVFRKRAFQLPRSLIFRPPAVRCPAASQLAGQQESSREAETLPDRRDVCRCNEMPFVELCRELEETKRELQSLKSQKVSQSGAETLSKESNPNTQEKVKAGLRPEELHGSHGEGSRSCDMEVLSLREEAFSLQREPDAHLRHRDVLQKGLEQFQAKVQSSQQARGAELLEERNPREELQVDQNRPLQETIQEKQQLNKKVQQQTDLLRSYRELQPTVQSCQNLFTTDIMAKRQVELLQEELESTKVSHQRDRFRFETELREARAEAQTLQRDLQREIRQKARLLSRLREEVRDHADTISRCFGETEALKSQLADLRRMVAVRKRARQQRVTPTEPAARLTERTSPVLERHPGEGSGRLSTEEPAEELQSAESASPGSQDRRQPTSVWKRVWHFLSRRRPRSRKD